MRVREFHESDRPILEEYAKVSGFPYPDPESPLIEVALVVVDSDDKPLIGFAAEQILQAYLWMNPELSPIVAKDALVLLHREAANILRQNCYHRELNAFLPPAVEKAFGRRLERTFGWVRNWACWSIRF